ncbi:MAG TPA: RidA family protein [Acidimicrobiales bacterium]|nr:RidA family protein [Acidimicrobiales bacterium]
MTEITRWDEGGPWAPRFGYVRALRVGDTVIVSGTTGTDESGNPAGPGGYEQARAALAKIREAIDHLAPEAVIVRTRVYVTDISGWEDVGRAHAEMFGDRPPVSTLIEVSSLVSPELVVEIEAEAVVV